MSVDMTFGCRPSAPPPLSRDGGLLFAPAWLPMVVPPKYPRFSRAAFGLCGLILLLVGGVIGFPGAEMMLYGQFTLLPPYALLALTTGVYFRWLAIHRDASCVER